MTWSLPTSVEIDGKEFAIRNKGDYRVVLDVIEAMKDKELAEDDRIRCALLIFYENLNGCKNFQLAAEEMMKFINVGEETEQEEDNKPPIMDWKHDFSQITPPINRVLGYSVRDANHYTHWYDFVGAYMEIGECTFSTIIAIRSKRRKGKPLDKSEQEFYKNNRKLVDLPHNLTEEEAEWLDSDW